jgi:DNA-binding transcriptional regulator LsrR (DeoR family)
MERLEEVDRQRLAARGVVADVVGHLFDASGRMVEDPTSERTIAAPVSSLRRAARVIAIAAGRHKVEGIIGACRTGLIHTLVTDQPTAEAITRRAARDARRPRRAVSRR